MPSVGTLKTDIKTLSEYALQDLFDFIGEIMTLNSLTRNLPKDCRESRFAKGEVCPHCNSTHVVKNGKLNDNQRYKCRGCNKTFNDFTKSALSYTKLSLEKWIEYAKCMVIGYSIRKSAEIVEIGVKTSFYMRHKILDCIGTFMGTGHVDGVVEMDETFVAESFKGNHKKSGFLMPRHSRKRGKEIKKCGISNEQICVATAIDRNNNIILEMICKGRVGYRDLERLYDGHIDHDSIIQTAIKVILGLVEILI
jgi:transposase-like protein